MDPNQTLRNMRKLADRIIATADHPDTDDALSAVQRMEERAVELSEAFQALDTWIASGGFLPAKWVQPPCKFCGKPAHASLDAATICALRGRDQ